jgi:hypothetical protein
MNALTKAQIERQDFVDNAIYSLLHYVNSSEARVEWNIEMIGDIRDRIHYWLVDYYKLTDEMTFYPYVEE